MSTPIEAIPQRPSRSSLFLAFILVILGLVATTLPTSTASIGAVKVLGWLLLFDGFAQLIYAFQSAGVGRTAWKLLVSILYLVGGTYLLANSFLGMAVLAHALAIIFVAEGFMDLTTYLLTRRSDPSALLLWHGIISMILGLIIWGQPSSSFRAIGIIVGISMFISGFVRIFLALEARQHGRSYQGYMAFPK